MQKSVLKTHYYSLVVLIAFAINVMLPFFAVYNPSASNTEIQHLSSVFGESIIICTGDGFKWVKLADLQNGKEKPKPHSDTKCPLCYAASHGLKSMAVASVVITRNYHQIDAPIFTYAPFLISFPYNKISNHLY